MNLDLSHFQYQNQRRHSVRKNTESISELSFQKIAEIISADREK